MSNIFLTTLTFILYFNLEAQETGLIYGIDNRKEAKDFDDHLFKEKALSVAIRVPNRKIFHSDKDNYSDFFKVKLSTNMPNLCLNERFSDQYQLGDCSGFLIAENKILTAGHCMFSKYDCENYSWVFDFNNDTENLKNENIYKCKSIIAQNYDYTNKLVKDYAIIELDRETNRKPLAYRHFFRPLLGTKLVIIGHPLGLPKKIANGAEVKFFNQEEIETPFKSFMLHQYYFTTNTDSYSGNSGSPVFNQKTGKVEGILIQGADDFKIDEKNNCMSSVHLSNSYKNSFEKVLRITEIPELN